MRVKLCERLIISKNLLAYRASPASIKLTLHSKHTVTTGGLHHCPSSGYPRKIDPNNGFLQNVNCSALENPRKTDPNSSFLQNGNRPASENPRKTDPNDSFQQNVKCLSEALAVPTWGVEVEQALANLPFRITVPHVVQILKRQQNATVVLCFFFWLRRLQGYRHNNLSYNSAVHVLIRARDFRFFEQILYCLQEDRCYISSITCNALIKAYGAAHKVEEAFNVFSRMDGHFLCKPNILTCNLLLHILIKEDELDWAHEFYHRVLNAGFLHDIFTCNIWMLYLCRSQKLKEAYVWLDEMPCPPNFVSYSTLIDGLCKASKMVEASSLFDRMLENEMSPDVFVFSSLVDGYCKSGMLHEAWKFFKLMDAKGIKANVVTYTSLLDGLFKAGKTDGALGLLGYMQSAGCAPNVHLCTVRVDALCKQRNLDAAGTLLKHMGEVGCPPNTVTYCALIDGHLKAGHVVQAMELMAQMSVSGCAPDAFLYSSLVYAFGRAGEDVKAKLILEESLVHQRSVPNTWIMNCWMSGLCRSGRFEDAYHLFINLKAEGFSPNTITYNILITGFSKSSKVDCARLVFEGLQQSSCVPDLGSYTNLVKGFCKIGALSLASRTLVEASSQGFVHNFRFHVYTVMNIFETRRLFYAKLFLKLLGAHCVFSAKADRMLYIKLLEARDVDAAARAVAKWKRLRGG